MPYLVCTNVGNIPKGRVRMLGLVLALNRRSRDPTLQGYESDKKRI